MERYTILRGTVDDGINVVSEVFEKGGVVLKPVLLEDAARVFSAWCFNLTVGSEWRYRPDRSGYTGDGLPTDELARLGGDLLYKPFTADELAAKVRRVLAAPESTG